jgi:hypothetical protein
MKNIQSIVLSSLDQTLYYFTRDAVIKNVLGKVTATLTEYLVGVDSDVKTILIKLYKTSEGFWYESIDEQNKITASVKLAIKSAIDRKESASEK